MTTDTTTITDTTTSADTAAVTAAMPAADDSAGGLWSRPGGRHRKPRRRSAMLAVGGLALVAGALALVRLGSDAVTGQGAAPAQAEPRISTTDTAAATTTGPGTGGADRHTAIRVPGTTRAATADSAGTSPRSLSARPLPSASPPSATDPATGIPEVPSAPRSLVAPRASTVAGTTVPGPVLSGTGSAATTTSPAAQASAPDTEPDPDESGLCVTLIGLCLGGG
ncbi:hypothetical protein AB0C59_34480 [Streptomyces sp. NPDC048664]|uniref:hypothetical protein n=1 Tax=Streptomyces sp. NPDC048664 TaxID=3154505 RepID=UPI00343E4E78